MKKTTILILALALLLGETAFAQWGGIGRAIKQEAQKSTAFSDKVSIEKIPASLEEFHRRRADSRLLWR